MILSFIILIDIVTYLLIIKWMWHLTLWLCLFLFWCGVLANTPFSTKRQRPGDSQAPIWSALVCLEKLLKLKFFNDLHGPKWWAILQGTKQSVSSPVHHDALILIAFDTFTAFTVYIYIHLLSSTWSDHKGISSVILNIKTCLSGWDRTEWLLPFVLPWRVPYHWCNWCGQLLGSEQIPSMERSHIPPEGKRKLIDSNIPWVSSQEGNDFTI